MQLAKLAARLGLDLGRSALLEQALTHRSAARLNYERLEFLGDALVDLYAAELLYERFPNADEGDLSRVRASLIQEGSLAAIARTLELGEFMRLGSSERKTGGWRRDSILADVLEAVVAAVYLELGFAAARDLVREWLRPQVDAIRSLEVFKDAKTRLQEWLQGRRLPLPGYELTESSGADHQKTFTVTCSVPKYGLARAGTGSSRRSAEQLAALQMLEALQQHTRSSAP